MGDAINQIHPITQFIISQGVPSLTVTILLLFPIIATIVVFLRQVFGLQAFGIYTPSIIAIAFIAIGQNQPRDLLYATIIYGVVLAVGLAMRYVLQKLRLLYLPRVALTITIVTLSVLLVLTLAGLAAKNGFILQKGFVEADIFPILIIITLVEKFVSVQIEKGSKTAIILALETFVIAIISYALLSENTAIGDQITDFILRYPYAILLLIPFHIFLGKWTGLRITEYLRFREVLKKIK